MPFAPTVYATASTAVATNGTLTFGYPTINGVQTTKGSFGGGLRHTAFVEGNQTVLNWPKDFSLTYNAQASGITFTYLGSTSIPAGTRVALQLDFPGEDSGVSPYAVRGGRVSGGHLVQVRLGAPLAASATQVVNAQAVANGNLVTLTTPVTLDTPRGLAYKSSNAGDTTQTLTVIGQDEFGASMTETVTLNGTTAVNGLKAFYKVISYKASAALAGNLSIGTQAGVLGIPVIVNRAGYVVGELQDGAKATAGTVTVADFTIPSATTGDVRGTYTPNSAPDGSKAYELLIYDPEGLNPSLTQF